MIDPIRDHILYEDDAVIVCRKQAGIPVQTARTGQQDMVSLLKNYRAGKKEEPYIGLVHRLDQPVEGIILFAKTKQAATVLAKQVSERNIDKYYYAVVWGKLEEPDGKLFDYLLKDGKTNCSAVVSKDTPGAKLAELSYHTLAETAEKSLLEICLKTGRHHQIRVQLSHAGHPIFGDSKYGARPEAGYLPLALCACRLGFTHPVTKKKMEFEIQPEGKAFLDFFPQSKK